MTPKCKECDGMGYICTTVYSPAISGLGERCSQYEDECDRCEGSGCEPLDNDDEE